MGYPGHLWTHGIDYGSREQDLRILFHGGTQARDVIGRYKVDYLLVGPIAVKAGLPPLGLGLAAPRLPLDELEDGPDRARLREALAGLASLANAA